MNLKKLMNKKLIISIVFIAIIVIGIYYLTTKNLTETIWGVLMGGFIGIFGSLIATLTSAYIDDKKWQKTEKLDILKREMEALKKICDEETEKYEKTMISPLYSTFTDKISVNVAKENLENKKQEIEKIINS
jgi:cell shape-determining protein MreC